VRFFRASRNRREAGWATLSYFRGRDRRRAQTAPAREYAHGRSHRRGSAGIDGETRDPGRTRSQSGAIEVVWPARRGGPVKPPGPKSRAPSNPARPPSPRRCRAAWPRLDRDHPSKSNGQSPRITQDSADVWQDQPLAKSMANGISPEASKAARLMLDRLKELSEISDGGSVETTLLCVPENKREHVLSVLETLSGRAPKTNTEDPLASAARLVRNAALELWAKPSHDEVETNLERLATTDYALRALRWWRAVRLGVRHKYARATAAAGRADNLGTCECRKTVEVDSGVARPGAAARVVPKHRTPVLELPGPYRVPRPPHQAAAHGSY